MFKNSLSALSATLIGLAGWASQASAEVPPPKQAMSTKCEGTREPGSDAPTPADPYPLMAAGWGPEVGNGLMYSRWAEDWTGLRRAGNAPAFKAMPLFGEASLTLSSEARLRFDTFDNGQLTRGNVYQQGLFRGVLGADLRFNPTFRLYGEVGTGQVKDRQSVATANFQNDA